MFVIIAMCAFLIVLVPTFLQRLGTMDGGTAVSLAALIVSAVIILAIELVKRRRRGRQ